ncbi:MAG: haloacid dehalogenase type II [Gammaproteobacteria bacterium]|nr:haloacid dehalogenase type II [Gammaproteobacteria bacterium]
MNRTLTEFSTLTFDCYGTLIDWESGIWDALQPLLMENHATGITRERALSAFAKAEHRLERENPAMRYPDLLESVHREIALHFGLAATRPLDGRFGQSVQAWPAFPDTADALRVLKQHFNLVILSNVHTAGFAASNQKLGVEFDAVYTAEMIGSYKPSERNFAYMLDRLDRDLGIGPESILHTAQSLFHDHVMARKFGLSNCWIDRQHLNDRGNWGATTVVADLPEFDFLFHSMGEMALAVQDLSST